MKVCRICKTEKNLTECYIYDSKNSCQYNDCICEACSDHHCITFEDELYLDKHFFINDEEEIELK